RSAGSSNASLSTLSRPATMFDSVLARFLNLVRGAANMAISPHLNRRTSSHLNPVRYPLFVWRFVSGQNNTTHTITAASEREARLQLPAVRLIFAARIRVQAEKPVTGMTSEDFCKNRLPEKFIRAYACPAPHKTGAGFDSLIVAAGSRS
ncbi:host cell division inhibitor Icd-like protein, partial [Salmonella enterica]|nr:host cell division inhibitor Icd-like protein [Salmonella enterica]